MRLLQGTPEEIAAFLKLMGEETEPFEEAVAGAAADAAAEPTTWAGIEALVRGRARTEEIAERVLAYLKGVLEIGGVEIEAGTSERTRDGLSNYVMVRDAGKRRYGAVAYVNAINAGLTLRLTPHDVADTDDPRIELRDVKDGHKYAVNCPLRDEETIDLALQLTRRALAKVR
ncbi:hypothetical protein Kpho02_60480 [Kitasatospora phosalacinea]|uniref:Uncharacterized protein n=1 Tax=Kitasatospora phosalacinea TaxID=2065 RepID=A0A9W6QC66_9ACTN|nr:hypothetical protein [Kitasatospora phosalacinea]GLW73750.1 hypothetical protein Kpho02_60480 [Kitasatospora phosalacinea]